MVVGGQKKSRSCVVMMLEMVLLISILAVIKESVFVFNCIRCFLSSPPTISLLLINLMVLLIFASSTFHPRHHQITTLLDLDHESPPPSPSQEKRKEEDHDTMEATWKAITGGGRKKKTLRKSETRPRRLESEDVLPTSPKWKELRKAETFNDAVSVVRRGGMIRRDPSMSLEEFNQKVEAFINNINNNFRLQRQESHQIFLDNINHTTL